MDYALTDTTPVVGSPAGLGVEILAYAAAARRGDVLPVCLRLAQARLDAAWSDRADLVRSVGPSCSADALDRACVLMPNASEPRLLRAARAIALAARATCAHVEQTWLDAARRDLLDAARLDGMDATARVMLSEIVGSAAWAAVRAA